MSEPRYRDWILETIDSLRSRKARPDLERICRMVRRRHGSDPDRTSAELEKLIREQTVLKVSYKGSISYRNAAKAQRKTRKRVELSGAEATGERGKPTLNNGDSAHSFTDQDEDEDSGPAPDPQPQPQQETAAESGSDKTSRCPGHGSGAAPHSCGATPGCAAGSGCEEEKASAPRDEGLGPQIDCPTLAPAPGPSLSISVTPSKADATGQEREPALPEEPAAGTKDKTYPKSDTAGVAERQSLKPKVPGATSTAGGGDRRGSDLGARLVASVRSLSERNTRGGSATRGHRAKPLGFKEILSYLSSHGGLGEEGKLTRGRVRVVLDREVARGRLRRTRRGNIALPPWGDSAPGKLPGSVGSSADGLPSGAPRDGSAAEKEGDPMERDSGEEDLEESEEEEDDDLRSSNGEGGLSPVAMTTKPGLSDKCTEEAEIQVPSKPESPRRQLRSDTGASVQVPLVSIAPPALQESPPSRCQSTPLDALGRSHTSSVRHSLERRAEEGVSSCLLTPTRLARRPRHVGGRRDGRGITGGALMEPAGVTARPADWTVSDVVTYFTAAGFPEQAAAFRAQEIDGKSLLLMQRNDVLTGLSIRLGPALKIYEHHVKVLQKTHFEDDDC